MIKITLYGRPTTKKNSQRIIVNKYTKKPVIIQSKNYLQYEKDCLIQLNQMKRKLKIKQPISAKINLKCTYYMNTRHRVDLTNLLNATNDVLVKAGVIQDDNSKIVVGHDGSRVRYDKNNPRVEIEMTKINTKEE